MEDETQGTMKLSPLRPGDLAKLKLSSENGLYRKAELTGNRLCLCIPLSLSIMFHFVK